MTDTIIKGSGNSRNIRSVPNLATLAPTWDKALELLTSSDGLPIDLLGPNPLGCEAVGTPLNKANLLSDITETTIWGSADDRTVDQALAQLRSLISTAQSTASSAQSTAKGKANTTYGSYTGTGSDTKTLYFSFSPKLVIVMAPDRGHMIAIVPGMSSYNSSFAAASVIFNSIVSLLGNALTIKGNISGWLPHAAMNERDHSYFYFAVS